MVVVVDYLLDSVLQLLIKPQVILLVQCIIHNKEMGTYIEDNKVIMIMTSGKDNYEHSHLAHHNHAYRSLKAHSHVSFTCLNFNK